MAIYRLMFVTVSLISLSSSATISTSNTNANSSQEGRSTQLPPMGLSYNELQYIQNTRNGFTGAPRITLSVCARAILGCCRQKDMNIMCSETLGCGAHFFDDNPCDDKFINDALKAAKQFYEQNTVET